MSKKVKNEEKIIINLNEDDKAVMLKTITNLISSSKCLYDLVSDNSLDEEMRDTLVGLSLDYSKDLGKLSNYIQENSRDEELRKQIIQSLQNEIIELKNQINANNIVDKIKPNLQNLSDILEKWWNVEGFNYIRSISYRQTGVADVYFSFSFSEFGSMYSKKPITIKNAFNEWLRNIQLEGFELVKVKNCGIQILDNENNRNLLIKLLKSRLPSCQIIKWDNYNYGDKGNDIFIIKEVNVLIYNLNDILKLKDINSKYSEIEED